MAPQWNGGVAVVDDEKSLNDLIVMALEMKGIPVCFAAYDGPEAIRMFREHNPKPGIVIMDYRLTSTTGVEAMKEMQQMGSKAKFIFLSADVNAKEEALKAGAWTFMEKPVSMKKIISMVEEAAGADSRPAM